MNKHLGFRWLLLFVLAGALLPAAGSSQSPPLSSQQNISVSGSGRQDDPPAGSKDADADEQDGNDQQPIFQTEIQVVTIPVTVTDPSGEFVTDLNPTQFRVYDNGKVQKIENFELSLEPVSLVVAVETSSRVESQLADVGKTGILFTQLVLGESGEAAVIGFDKEVRLIQDFTQDSDQVEAALKKLKAGGDDVRMSDALTRALALLQRRPKERRKVVVVLSEARDTGSSNTPGIVLRAAQQLGISVYTVGLSTMKGLLSRTGNAPSSPFPPGVAARPTPANAPPTPQTQSNVGAANLDLLPLIQELVSYTQNLFGGNPLALYAQGTGAQEFSNSGKESVQDALSRIGRELRSQYLLTYRPDNLEKPGFHTIQVAVTVPSLRVRTRPGYMFGGAYTGSGSVSAPARTSPESNSPDKAPQ